MNYYSSDPHASHLKALEFRNFSTVEEMNEAIIAPILAMEENDDYFCLGDVAFGEKSLILEALSKAKCRKHLIWGNHDSFTVRNCNIWTTSQQYAEIKDGKHNLVLFHYPIMDWNRKRYGSIHLHGHMHSNDISSNMADMGLDNVAWDFKPQTLESALSVMKNYPPSPTYSHH